jgi:hypothetical protein
VWGPAKKNRFEGVFDFPRGLFHPLLHGGETNIYRQQARSFPNHNYCVGTAQFNSKRGLKGRKNCNYIGRVERNARIAMAKKDRDDDDDMDLEGM